MLARLQRAAIQTLFLVTIASGAASLHARSNEPGGAWEAAPPPPEQARAISLSGRSDNVQPENWLRLRGTAAAPWWVGPTGTLVVRNVSQATLTPFLPDPSKATGAAMIVAPGGGTLVLSMDTQGYQIARWLNERGIAAFVLKYRLVPTPARTDLFLKMVGMPRPVYSDVIPPGQSQAEEIATREDASEAVRYVRSHSSQWKLSRDRIGIIGFSAGAYTAVGLALNADEASRPNAVAAIYGTMSGPLHVGSFTPPLFLAAAFDDPLNAEDFASDPYSQTYLAWRRARVPAELHIFDTGGHGFGVAAEGKSSDQWLGLLDHWLREHRFAKAGRPIR